jgi:hypothetical protein
MPFDRGIDRIGRITGLSPGVGCGDRSGNGAAGYNSQ